MTSERWQAVGALFDQALAQAPAERAAWVDRAAAPADVRQEVLALLASHEAAGTFLDGRAADHEPPPPPMPAIPRPPGTTIGPYRIVRLLGQGGMGIVYQGEDTRLERPVALKLVAPHLAQDERVRHRLRYEARAAASLAHAGIGIVYAFEEIGDDVLIVSEYLEGTTLREEIARGPLAPAAALATARALARALAAAHARGIVHRDLKPENVFRTTSGAVKILDFGLAQVQGAAETWTRLTEPGVAAGTPPYMPPEQLLGEPTDFRADHFAFGVLLYEMICGRHAFGGTSLPSTIARILAGTPQAPDLPGEMPAALWAIVERCLRRSAAERFASTDDLVRALEAADLASPVAAAPAPASGVHAPAGRPALWWWQFHQLATAIAYWSMIWPTWHVHRWLGRGGVLFFLGVLAAVIVGGNLRLHLWFSSRIYPAELARQRAWLGTWIRWADVALAALLAAGGLAIIETHFGWGALLVGFAIGSALAFLVIEPTTSRAAFLPGGPHRRFGE